MRIVIFLILTAFNISVANIYQETLIKTNGKTEIRPEAYHKLLNATASDKKEMPSHRDVALQNNALRVSQQYGYADQLHFLQKTLEATHTSLSQIFNFQWLLGYVSHDAPVVNLLPPVILASKNYVQGDTGTVITISDQYYQLYAPARLATIVPSWRDYLLYPIPLPEELPTWLLPHNKKEQSLWKITFQQGWQLGVKQANEEMRYRINRLNRDFNGMLTYLCLYEENKVSSPFVAYSQNTIEGDHTAMSVNNKVYRITIPAKLNKDVNHWRFQPQDVMDHA